MHENNSNPFLQMSICHFNNNFGTCIRAIFSRGAEPTLPEKYFDSARKNCLFNLTNHNQLKLYT